MLPAGSLAAVSGTPRTYITDSHASSAEGNPTVITTSYSDESRGTYGAVTPDVVSSPSGGETVVVPAHGEMPMP